MLEIKIFIAYMLRSFSFEPSTKYEVDERHVIALRPQYRPRGDKTWDNGKLGLPVVMKKLRPDQLTA
jgi:hypothetical protein